ncbi:Xaa-Pro aminopeptidase [Alteromonas sp. ASW11-36]|uniref:Xaa-Pro aminopeptidase n=1 Tax=Alteromonas arenosi TaxID=3055817 RepID=A0ABT7STQ2_9ALTE|nr:Xaa-Pro aminopeptidase [Alteromonas sp. ASW11-36]MDM7859567.1 Xaa-Pro aminopeptidase [Alteromonas sp. ASW11-36]
MHTANFLEPQFHLAQRLTLLRQFKPNSVCVVPAARLQTRSNDTEYLFRQDSDFWYLTGFHEPDAWLILSNSKDYDYEFSVLACLPKDEHAEIWQGRRVGPEAAVDKFLVDDSCSTDEIEWALHDIINGHDNLYFALGQDAQADELVQSVLEKLRSAPKQSKQAPATIIDVRPMLHEMRLIKQPDEIAVMRQVAQISSAAHCRAMREVSQAQYEYQLEAAILHEFACNGARHAAYNSIVGSGENACILHYNENDAALQSGDLVLIDAGAELYGYAADITRTFPVSGRFSESQKALYQLVLDAQLAALNELKPGSTISQAMMACLQVLVAGLVKLGILSGDVDTLIEEKAYQPYFMHGLGHWLGLDVHDVGIYKIDGSDRPLQPGMALTVEPGLYISANAEVPVEYRGIGIRIEDDIVITAQGHEVLTAGVPKTVETIEALINAPA